jgi:glycine cleavage system H protein
LKVDDCEFPDALLYDVANGTWAKPEGSTLRVGITSLLSWASGPFHSVTFKPPRTEVHRGQVLGSFEGAKHFDVVRSPVSGILSETNLELVTDPRLLNKDCYGNGWFARVRVKKTEELDALSRLPDAAPAIATSLRERRVHCFAEFPDHEMFEIGVECAAVLVRLNELLAGSAVGTVVHVVSDDNTADTEMQRWSHQTGNAVVQSKKEGDLYHFIVKKEVGKAKA